MDKLNKKLLKKRVKAGLYVGAIETARRYKIFRSNPELQAKIQAFRLSNKIIDSI